MILSYTNYNKPEPKTNPSTLFKIWSGDKYYIWKSIAVKTLMEKVAKQIDQEIRIPKQDSIFSKLTEHCRKTGDMGLRIEVMKDYPNDNFQLLVDEYELLKASKKDKNCLNKEFANHKIYPRWIAQDDINRFKKYYTTGKNVGSSAKDKRLRRFLNTHCEVELTEIIYNYVKKNYS